ncbi:MAG: site-specific integrase [Spirochaetaceae bacterium]|nr:MAG: site-specific integrase [Spirochaetaceae bacterium]
MNNLVVCDKHYLKHSEEFLQFVGEAPANVQEFCIKANEFLKVKAFSYAPATLSLLRVGLKKTIMQTLGDKQYNSVYKEALDSAFRQNVPVIKADKAVRETKYLKRHEVETLLKNCTTRVSLLVQFLFFTGCRISEALNLRLSDCKPSGQLVALRILGKGRKERILNIPVSLFEKLQEFYKGEHYLFETRNHHRWNNAAFYRELKRQALKHIGKHVHPHMLRHSLCSYLLNDRNVSIAQVSKMLGHSSIKITVDMYHHGAPEYGQLFDEKGDLK